MLSLAAAIGSAVLSFALKMLWPELPFIDRVGLVFLLVRLKMGPAPDESLDEKNMEDGGY